MSDTIPITFEGETLAARRGEPLAATLAAHGRLALRTTRKGAERGLFCGMGACQDCLVSIDGSPGQRACLTKVEGPMSVRREAEGRPLPLGPAAPPPSLAADYRVERPDVLVVGGGPGGLAAALAARRAGADVLLLDERSKPGGQYFKQSAVGSPRDAQQRRGAALVAEVRAAGVEMRGGTAVWGAFAPRTFAATAGGRTILVEPRVAIVATGAYEQAWPVPGWTLPGVMTTGAAQTLWRTAGRLPGRRVLIAGNGPLNLQLAAELMAGGAEVALAEAATRPGIGALAELARMAAAAPMLVAQGAGLTARLGRRLRWSTHLARVDAEPGDLRATLAGEHAESLSVDAVCLGYGFRPSGELLRGLGARHVINPDGRRVVHRDEDGATDAENVFAIGDGTGLGGAHAAMAEGELAGRAAAARLGLAVPSGDAARRTLARHRRFQTALWSLYRTDLSAPSTPDTILCRCEEVTFAEVEAARAGGVSLIGAVKQETRCGMGRCQGRYCAPVLEALLGQSPDEWSGFAPQVPVMPVAIGDLAP